MADIAYDRQRAWSFVLDGHTFYALDLGEEGTFLYDTATEEWCQFKTEGFVQWDMLNGTMWADKVVAGDFVTGVVRELVQTAALDNDALAITRIATGGLLSRDRDKVNCAAVRVTATVGALTNEAGTDFTLRFSDDNGNNWVGPFTVALPALTFDTEIAFRSLGSFAAPGRIFELTDVGGPLSIDGADAEIPEMDNQEE